jgi:hypothetical protein
MNEFRGDRVFSREPIILTGDDILQQLAIQRRGGPRASGGWYFTSSAAGRNYFDC